MNRLMSEHVKIVSIPHCCLYYHIVVMISPAGPGASFLQPVTASRNGSGIGEAEAKLTWNRPVPNGIITSYEVFVNGSKTLADVRLPQHYDTLYYSTTLLFCLIL